MRIQEIIRKLQAVQDEHGNLRVEVRNPAGDASDAEDVKVDIDHKKLPYVLIDT